MRTQSNSDIESLMSKVFPELTNLLSNGWIYNVTDGGNGSYISSTTRVQLAAMPGTRYCNFDLSLISPEFDISYFDTLDIKGISHVDYGSGVAGSAYGTPKIALCSSNDTVYIYNSPASSGNHNIDIHHDISKFTGKYIIRLDFKVYYWSVATQGVGSYINITDCNLY